nr:efflux RND transporter periplasmic adaptor subunit [uncultured Desulfobacter sp.]
MSEETIEKKELTFFGKTIRALIPLMLIIGGGVAWSYFKATAPVMKKAEPQRQVTLVETQTAVSQNLSATVSAMGTVTAAREVTLKAQVTGTVQSVCDNFVPGSFVAKGKTVLTLDPADYQVAKKKAQSALANAKAALAIEQGSQNIAKEELRVLSEITVQKVNQTDLALRKPQLAQAMAAVTSAQADLTQADLNLSRTRIVAPFNAMILERSVNVGTYVGVQDSLVSLVGTDEFWIEAVVPLDEIPFLDMDTPGGCPVRIRSQAGTGTWDGRVIQVTGQLSDTSRMAQVLVGVKNPLGTLNHPSSVPLMIDDYVYVDITGRTLEDVMALPRTALKDDNTLWVNQNNTLDIRKVTLAWKDETNVYIQKGISPGDQVVVSDLSTPVQGMALKSSDSVAQKTQTERDAS